jgi:hypothetical protein
MAVSQNPADSIPKLWYKIQDAALQLAALRGRTVTGPSYLSDGAALNKYDPPSIILHKVLAIFNALD